MKWLTFLKQYMLNREHKLSYITYRDSKDNKLASDEILFMDTLGYEEYKKDKKTTQARTIRSKNVIFHFDESGNFPIALTSEMGTLLYLKVSKKTGELLPIHAGCCPVKRLIYTGAPSAGKTVSTLQMTDPAFHDAIASGTTCSMEDDLPTSAPKRVNYEEARRVFKKDHILPEPTRRDAVLQPYIYYIQYGTGEKRMRYLLEIQDMDGESSINMTWQSKILKSDCMVLTIGADELVAGEQGLEARYNKVVDQLIPRLRVLRQDKEYDVVVVLTKCDCLDKQNVFLKGAFTNSVQCEDGKLKQTTHATGFDYEVFHKRSECVQNYIKSVCPNLFNKLENAIPKGHLTFCMMASVGEEAVNNRFVNYNPFCIDEPLVYLLTELGLYPIKVANRKKETQKVGSFSVINKKTIDDLVSILKEEKCHVG